MNGMKLTFDRDILEAAYLALGPRPYPDREAIYEISDEQRREEAFTAHVGAWFRESGIESRIRSAFDDCPLVRKVCEAAIIRRVRNPADEMAELFRNDDGANRIGIGMRAGRIQDGSFGTFLRHELYHIQDMLDPAFGYPGPSAASCGPEASLCRERYGLLWDITIDGRLARRFESITEYGAMLERQHARFESTFGFLAAADRASLFEELSGMASPRHDRLWQIAADPRQRRLGADVLAQGGRCPICGFTTFEWADEAAVGAAGANIVAEFPDWAPGVGCCARCAEIYGAFDLTRVPATVLLPNRKNEVLFALKEMGGRR